MPLDRRQRGRVLVELWYDGFVTVTPPRRELDEDERRWVAEVARPELHARWVRLLQHEAGPRMRRRRARRIAERQRVVDELARRLAAGEVEGRRRRRQYQQLAFTFGIDSEPSASSTAS
jgi:hypothetical protein